MFQRKAKVFISCGQRTREKKIAEKVAMRLDEHGYNPYLACNIMSLDPITIVTKELSSSDYYLFIDFKRKVKSKDDLPISLFSHQELALAHHLGFRDEIIVLREHGVPKKHGILWYVLSNAEYFKKQTELLRKLDELIDRQGWSPNFSRNLVIKNFEIIGPYPYGDHTGHYYQRIGEVEIENRRPDVAAVDAVCILDKITDMNGIEIELKDRTYLKSSGQKGYRQTILPKDSRKILLFAMIAEKPGLFLNSMKDEIPRKQIIKDDGDYILFYKIYSQGFPLLEFQVQLKLKSTTYLQDWPLLTTAKIIP